MAETLGFAKGEPQIAIFNKDLVIEFIDGAGEGRWSGCAHGVVKLVCLEHIIEPHLACHSLYG
jgi:hypothetical protein